MTKSEKRDILDKLPNFNPKWVKETQKVWLEAMKALIEVIKAVEPHYYPVPVYERPFHYRWWDWGTPFYGGTSTVTAATTGNVTMSASSDEGDFNASCYLAANNEPLPSDFKFEKAHEAFSELESIISDKGVTGDMLTELVAA